MACLCIWLGMVAVSGAQQPEAAPRPLVDLRLPAITPGEPITLADALRLADQRNLSLAVVRADILEAQAQLKASWGVLLPTATGSTLFTHNDHADFATIEDQQGQQRQIEVRPQQEFRVSLQTSMPLINAQMWQGIVSTDLGVDVAELRVETARQALLLIVAQGYYQALTAQKIIQIHENQISSSQRHLAVATVRHRSGTGALLDVIRAKTELLTGHEEILSAHAALDNARDALATLMDVEGLPLPVEVAEMETPAKSEDDLIRQASRQREDLRLSAAMVELATSQLTGAWMQFIPSLSASWQLNHQFSQLGQFGSQDETRWYLGLTLTIPIYDQIRYADLDLKRASLQRAKLDAEDAEKNAWLEVRQARRAHFTALEQVVTAREKARLAAQSLQLAETAYENGTGSSLDVTDARRQSRAAEIDLATRRFYAQLALLQLLRAAGSDMRSLAEKGTR